MDTYCDECSKDIEIHSSWGDVAYCDDCYEKLKKEIEHYKHITFKDVLQENRELKQELELYREKIIELIDEIKARCFYHKDVLYWRNIQDKFRIKD